MSVKVIFAICTVAKMQQLLEMSNQDIKDFGDITVLQELKDCKAHNAVIIPWRNNNGYPLPLK